MLNVNVIEFGGRTAVINSYSDHPALEKSMIRQREEWATTFPRAVMETRRMSVTDVEALIAANRKEHGRDHGFAHFVGRASQGCEA